MPLSPLDPARPFELDADARTHARLAALERRIRTLEGLLSGGAVQQIPVVDELPTAGRLGRLVMLRTDGRVYRDTGATWTSVG